MASKSGKIPFVLKVLEARNLGFGCAEISKTVDPFVEVKLKEWRFLQGHQSQKTIIIPHNSNPVWNQEFVLYPKSNDILIIKIWDKEAGLVPNSLLGKISLSVSEYFNRGIVDQWIPLTLGKKAGSRTPNGHLRISCSFNQPALTTQEPSVSTVITESTIPTPTPVPANTAKETILPSKPPEVITSVPQPPPTM